MNRFFSVFLIVLFFSVSSMANERSDERPTFGNNPRVVAGPSIDGALATLDESFEGATFPPAGWTKYSPDGGSGWEQIAVGTTPIPGWTGGIVTPVPNGMGGNAMAFATWNTGGPVANEQWLISPQVTGVQTGDELSFWLRKYTDAYSDTVYIKISTTDTSAGSFSDLAVIGFAAADSGWAEYNYSLDSFNGQDIYVAFVEQVDDNFNNGDAIFIDLVSVGSSLPMARAQVIHNSADAAAAVVDVWLNDALLLDDFAFRTASPYIDAPAGVDFDITIQPSNSTDTTNGLWRQTYQLADGETYVLIADGIVSGSGYNPATAFDIYVYGMGQEMAAQSGNTDVLVFHGATDAPTVDVVEVGVGAGTIVDDISFGEYQGYLELGTLDYRLDVRDATGTVTVATYDAPLSTLGLQDEAIVVFASGFLDPSQNSNGEAFGLWVALPDGATLPLPVHVPNARAQVIHNSADAAAAVVDVWLNDALLLDDFAFRTASPYIDAPAGVDFDITIQPSNSTDTTNGLWRQTYQLADGETYVLIADGIVSPSGYNPATAFDIYVYGMGQEMAAQSGNTDVLVFHGATDAPTVDVVEVGVGAGTIVDDISFGEYQGYLELGTLDYRLDVRDATGTVTVATYDAPLSALGLQDEAIVVFASGFLDPSMNSNGEAFGLWVALANGATVALPVYTPTARAQVIHNSADAAAAVVDVWLNDALLLDDFAFRTASPFIDAPAGVDFDITIQPSNSTDTTNGLWRQTYQLADGETYVLIADGIVSGSGYNPATAFDIYVYGMGQEMAAQTGNTDVLVFHGATDAPTVDVVEVSVGAGTIVDDISFGEYQGYLELGTLDYRLDVRDATGTVTVATYDAPLSTLGLQDEAIVVFASGFLDPSQNSSGPAFGLWVALASGAVVPLPEVITSIDEWGSSIPTNYTLEQNYPNPFNPSTKIRFALPKTGNVTLKVFDVTGRVVATLVNGNLQAGEFEYTLDGSNLSSGVYFYRIQADGFNSVRQMILIK